jgi:hypothetical protein
MVALERYGDFPFVEPFVSHHLQALPCLSKRLEVKQRTWARLPYDEDWGLGVRFEKAMGTWEAN